VSAILQDKIAAEVALLRPRGWKKALYLLREWSVLGVTATIVISLLALALTEWNSANGHLATEASFRTHTEDRLTAVETSLLAMRASRASATPTDRQSQMDAKDVLSTARKDSIRIPANVVEEAGRSFVGVAATDQKAWDSALDFIAYRSSLNMPPSMAPTKVWSEGGTLHYAFAPVPGKAHPKAEIVLSLVPAEQAAIAEPIGQDPNAGIKYQPSWLIVTGGAMGLEDEHFRNVVFEHVEIHYSGSPIVLENVSFISCVFVFDNNDRGRELGQALLASSGNVNFRALA
jgi:hypothetical protein